MIKLLKLKYYYCIKIFKQGTQKDIELYTLNGTQINNNKDLIQEIKNKQFDNYINNYDYITNKLIKCKNLYNNLNNNLIKIFPIVKTIYPKTFILEIYNIIKLIKQFMNDLYNISNQLDNPKNSENIVIINRILLTILGILEIYEIIYTKLDIKFSIQNNNNEFIFRHINIYDIEKYNINNDKEKYNINNFFDNMRTYYTLVYTDMSQINTHVINTLDKLFNIITKVQTSDTNKELENIMNEFVELLNLYNINYINAFDLTDYYNKKKEELIKYNDNLQIIRNTFVDYLYEKGKVLSIGDFIRFILI